jgi:carbon-monoxide dehydrogenase small subunit
MIIRFTLNGEDATTDTEAETRLIDLLRGNFKLMGAKMGCLTGRCGACFVFINGKVSPSCIVPAFSIRGAKVVTIEGFSQTNEYHDIVSGFAQAGIENCGFCDAGKILVTAALLEKKAQPARQDILAAFRGVKCRCTEPESLTAGVLAAAEIRQRRLYGRGA